MYLIRCALPTRCFALMLTGSLCAANALAASVSPREHPTVDALSVSTAIAPTDIAPTDNALCDAVCTAVNSNDYIVVALDERIRVSAMRESIKPDYPEPARQAGVEGFVLVQFDITREGNVADVHVIEAQPANYFETAAMDAVKRFRFTPDTNARDGIVIRGAVNRFEFSLSNKPGSNVPTFIPHRGRTLFAAISAH